MIRKIAAVAVAGLFTAALYAASKPVTVELKDAKGESVGTAKLSEGKAGSGVKIQLEIGRAHV